MRHQPTVEQPNPVSPTLHLTLQNALACLDIQLEEELVRYRRLKAGKGRSPRSTNRRSQSKPLDLIAISATGGRTEPSRMPTPSAPPTASHSLVDTLKTLPYLADPLVAQAVPTPEMVTTPAAMLAIAVPSPDTPLAPAHQDPPAPLSHGYGDDLAGPSNPPHLEDYLESSEELLRSLAEKETAVQSERSFMRSLLTPLGAGSMLLLLMSSAMFGYVMMNPSSLGRLFALNGVSSRSSPSGVPSDPNQGATVAPQPNLAAQEFQDLNLNTLGTLESDPAKPKTTLSGKPTTAPSSLIPPTSLNAPAAVPATGVSGGQAVPLVPPAPQVSQPSSGITAAPPAVRTYEPPHPARTAPVYSPAPASEPPARSAPASTTKSPTAAASAPAISANSQGGSVTYPYKIVTPYSGDPALEAAKKVSPDAFMTNLSDGAYIQYGASHNEAEAESRARTLREQGIPAAVMKK